MSVNTFKFLVASIGIIFTAFFVITIVPPLLANPDILGALAAGFVNPYAAGYSTDVILCWVVLLVWVVYEAKNHAVKHGWLCLLIGMVPGVAAGFALYLILRERQIRTARLRVALKK